MDVKTRGDYFARHLTKEQQKTVIAGLLVTVNRFRHKSKEHGPTEKETIDRIEEILNLAVNTALETARLKQVMD